jgi:hypothetical protein
MAEETLFIGTWTEDGGKTGWTLNGTAPYLTDDTANYVNSATKKASVGDFEFANSGVGSGTINSVNFYAYGQSTGDPADITVFLSEDNGSTWDTYANYAIPTTEGWGAARDVSVQFDTWAKIDAAELYFDKENNTDPITVHRAKLVIDYSSGTTHECKGTSAATAKTPPDGGNAVLTYQHSLISDGANRAAAISGASAGLQEIVQLKADGANRAAATSGADGPLTHIHQLVSDDCAATSGADAAQPEVLLSYDIGDEAIDQILDEDAVVIRDEAGPAAGATHSLKGTSSAQGATPNAILVETVQLISNDISATSGASGNVHEILELKSDGANRAAATSGATGNVQETVQLKGSSDATSGASSILVLTELLAGISSATGGASALARKIHPVKGISTAQSGADAAQPTATRALLGTSDGQAGADATQPQATLALHGTSTAQGGASANVQETLELKGTSTAQSTADAAQPSVTGEEALVGTSSATSGASGALTLWELEELVGSASANSGASGALTLFELEELAGTASATGGASALPQVDWLIKGAIAATSGGDAAQPQIVIEWEIADEGLDAIRDEAEEIIYDERLGGEHDLKGTISAQSGATAAPPISTSVALKASLDRVLFFRTRRERMASIAFSEAFAVSGGSASLSVNPIVNLAGLVSATSSASAVLEETVFLVGAIAATSGALAHEQTILAIAGLSQAQSTADAAQPKSIAGFFLRGSSAAQAGVQGNLVETLHLISQVDATATAAARAPPIVLAFSGVVTAQSTTSGRLPGEIAQSRENKGLLLNVYKAAA